MARGRSQDKEKQESKYVNWILAAIAKVKGQKQRPSEDRISHVLEVSYGMSKEEAVEQLELCVKNGDVLKVAFKGQASYKDPAVVTQQTRGQPQTFSQSATSPKDLRRWVQHAIEELDEENGSSIQAIEKKIREIHEDEIDTRTDLAVQVKVALKRGLMTGRFIKEGSRLYKVMEKKSGKKSPEKSSGSTQSSEGIERQVCEPSPICGFCQKTAESNKKGEPEELISCADCGNSGHASCLNYSSDLVARIKQEPWQCIECKVCNLCEDAGNADNLLFCDTCDKGFHMECLEPPMTEAPTGTWICSICLKTTHKKRKAVKELLLLLVENPI